MNLQLHYEKIYTIFFQKFQECKIRNYVQKSVLFQDFLCDSDGGGNFGSSYLYDCELLTVSEQT